MNIMTIHTYIFAFFFFAFSGWVGECGMESVVRRKWVNKGFFHGPWVPVHGLGAFAVHYCLSPLRAWPPAVFVAGVMVCTAIEYGAALVLEKGYHVKCWDYETYPFTRWCHYKKRVALTTSLFFGLVALALVYFYWDLFLALAGALDKTLPLLNSILVSVFALDAVATSIRYLRNKKRGLFVKHSNDFSTGGVGT